jgi:Tfp pilus assembly protein PilF
MMNEEQVRNRIEGSVEDIAENLKFAKSAGIGCTLLIGAGCSLEAGIPLASKFVQIIEKEFPSAYRRAKEKDFRRATERGDGVDKDSFVPSYSSCMAELPDINRRQLFARYVDKATINWAHLCIASLVKAGYVDRILTTNFDALIVQACALLGEYPAVYDFASSQRLEAYNIPLKAVFHLHGQRTGFVLLNTDKELEAHFIRLSPLIDAARYGRIWIVVGYSGENDPVFRHLANSDRFENDVFWIGYKQNPPRPHICKDLLNKDNTYYVPGYDADSFFKELTKQLRIFPPDLVARPFSQLEKFLDVLPSDGPHISEARHLIKLAIAQFEKPQSLIIITGDSTQTRPASAAQQQVDQDVQRLLLQKQMAAVDETDPWTHMLVGNVLSKRAGSLSGAAADELFSEAGDRYQRALQHKPDHYQALNNWGVALYYQAKVKPAAEAEEFFNKAREKFQAALAQESKYSEALNNLGATLYELALLKADDEAQRLLAEAVANFEATLKYEPDSYQAYMNLGNAFIQQAGGASEQGPKHLFELAKGKFKEALNLAPDPLQILNIWGTGLLAQLQLNPEEDEFLSAIIDEITNISDRADRLSEGSGQYLSACLNALNGNEDDCRQALIKARAAKALPSRAYLQTDPKLESVRDAEWFVAFIQETFD